ncbi:MAG: sugar phosphate isomerase/epimerase family protein [Novosphingobium sp.]
MNRIGIENLSTFGLDPVEFVHLAAELGCGHVSLNLSGSANRLPDYPVWSFRDDPALVRRTAHALRQSGVTASLVEGFAVLPDRDMDHARDLDLACELGAKAICTVSIDRDEARTHAEYARLAEQAGERGLVTTTEACAGAYRTLAKSMAAVETVGRPDFVLLIDTMHFFRSGSSVADFAALNPAIVGHIQLCDVPMPALIESYMEEALYERRAPGDGDLPLREFLALAPEHVPIGLEIPIRSEALTGIGPRERLGRCVAAARNLLAGIQPAEG